MLEKKEKSWMNPAPRKRGGVNVEDPTLREDLSNYRDEFPITRTCTFLNHASRSPLPNRSLQAIERFLRKSREDGAEFDEEAFQFLNETRELIARLICASPQEIALFPNTSMGINIAARGLQIQQGENVIIPEKEFPANVFPWLNLQRDSRSGSEGVEVRFIPVEKGVVSPESVEELIDEKTRAVSIGFVDFSRGAKRDLERIGALCEKKGVPFIVDGMQGVGVLNLDVKRCRIDLLACGGAKWLMSPHGTGFTYIREGFQKKIQRTYFGWLAVKGPENFEDLLDYSFKPFPGARSFEVGTYPYHDFYGMKESLILLLEIGIKNIEKRVFTLTDLLIKKLEHTSYSILSPLDTCHRSAILSIGGKNLEGVFSSLTDAGIFVSKREGGIRVSPHFYNTEEEIEKLVDVLKGIT
ncbi:aminotransferase class V-fold PLP-dependent enzyme [candidate division TA06 bacterium]|nr:aminotransferase class V-fold PLP-dependent enzyme [candidate division TA06 bacterium]